jgi:glycosyltransferase involved in cell wall biosynthesis
LNDRPDLSVVIPAYNESRRLASSLERICGYVEAAAVDAEIIVVDDGSTDGTADLARRLLAARRGTVLADAINRGKGWAVRCGVLEARGRAVLVTDADLSCSIDQYPALAAAMQDRGLDVAIGSRSLPASSIEVRQHRGRELMGQTFNVLVRAATGLPFGDTQCGFKLLNAETTRPVVERLTVDGFAFDVELLLLCRSAGLRIGEVPITWRNSRDSRVSVVGAPARMLFDLARLALRARGPR